MSFYPEVRRGGNLPFGQSCNRWVCDPRYSTNCRTLYSILVSYVDTHTRDTERGRPYRPELARQLGCSLSTLDRTLLEGEVAGLWSVHQRTNPDNPDLNDANVYELHDAALMYAGHGEWVDPLPAGILAADVAKQRIEERRAAKRAAGQVRMGGVAKGVSTKKLRAERTAQEASSASETPGTPGAEDAASPSETAATEAPQTQGGSSTGAARGSSTRAARVAARVLPNVYSPVHSPDLEPEKPRGSAVGQGAGGFACAGARSGADEETPASEGGSAANQEKVGKGKRQRGQKAPQKISELRPVVGEEEVYALLDGLGALDAPAARINILRRAVREFLGHNPNATPTPFDMYPRTPEHAATRLLGGWHRARGPLRASEGYPGSDRILRPAGYLAEILFEQACELPNCETGILLDTGEWCRQCRYRANERIQDAEVARLDAQHREELEQQRAEAALKRQAEIEAVYDEAVAANEAFDRMRAARAAEAEETARLREQLAAEHPELIVTAPAAEIPGPRDHAGASRRGQYAVEEETARAALLREGLRGTALDDAVRSHMSAWRLKRREEAQAADLAARAVPVGAWPTGSHQQPEEAPF
ncbi:hypothetical protein [Streptomyces erythrochromogenes]|uniref:hypothetical protein n=1 Tax=Streptomyces erythrochromogenes TaxID=285574 RepID=UPI00381DD1A5